MAAVLALGPEAVMSHRSAAQLWGLMPRSPIAPEVTRPGFVRTRAGLVIHRSTLRSDEIEVENGIPVTSASRTQFDLAAVLSRRQNATLRELLADKEPGGITRNDFEERFVAFLDAHGVPRPRFNATIALRGRFFEADCLWAAQRLMVELDSRTVHGTDRAFESDRQRDRILLAEGWRSTRITWRQLHDEPEAIAADLRCTLGHPPNRPSADH
jgi:very-short-patch-repair endonuclease